MYVPMHVGLNNDLGKPQMLLDFIDRWLVEMVKSQAFNILFAISKINIHVSSRPPSRFKFSSFFHCQRSLLVILSVCTKKPNNLFHKMCQRLNDI